jgi:NAD(P)H-flavin reductase/predicted heme/steroid binding protein
MNQDLAIYTIEELAQRNGRTLPNIWVGYKSLIYDVTTSELFKDGKHYFHDAGKDLTLEMGDAPHMDDVMSRFPVVGRLTHNESESIVPEANKVEVPKRFTFIERHQVSSSIYRFFFECSNDSLSNDYVGQYVSFLLTIQGVEYKRSYSIASIQGNIIEFLIQLKPQGIVSNYLIFDLQQKDLIEFKGPFGGVAKSTLYNKKVKLICTDVGIAPIRNIIHYLLAENSITKHVELIYGAHNFSELIYHDEFTILEKVKSNFNYFPYSTQQKSRFCRDGYFTNDSNFILREQEVFYVIVGWERMINRTKELVKEKNIDKSYIYVQLYN